MKSENPVNQHHKNEKPCQIPVESVQTQEIEIKLYRRRWIILTIFMVYCISAGLQWMQYSIITNIVKKYYKVEEYMVEWTTMIHMVTYVLIIIPALWFLEKMGNRNSMLIAGGGIAIGAWIKLFAVERDSFIFVLIGQIIEASAQVITFGLAGVIAATWFGSHEISLAGSLAFFGDQLGAGVGFILPPFFVEDSDDHEEIGQGIYNLCFFITALASLSILLIIFFFKEKPEKPPSLAQIARKTAKENDNILQDLTKLFKIKGFLLSLFVYGMHIGSFDAHGTLLNRIFCHYFPSSHKEGGTLGCLIILCGLVGSGLGGRFLDKKHLFKETTCLFYFISTICMAGYTYAYYLKHRILVYIMACTMGIFMFGYYSVAIQLSIELVHPYSEGTVTGLSLLFAQLVGVTLTPAYRFIFETYDPLQANVALVCVLFIGSLLSLKIPANYRRQIVENGQKPDK